MRRNLQDYKSLGLMFALKKAVESNEYEIAKQLYVEYLTIKVRQQVDIIKKKKNV